MSTTSKGALLAGILCLIVVAGSSVTAAAAPVPQRESAQATLQNGSTRLNYFVGTWKISRTVQPSVFGPGGEANGTMTCDWVINGIVLNCLSEGTWPYGNGKMSVLQVIQYNPANGLYSITGFDNMGDRESTMGNVAGTAWTFSSTEKVGDQIVNALWTFKEDGPDSMGVEFRLSTTGVEGLLSSEPIAVGRNERLP